MVTENKLKQVVRSKIRELAKIPLSKDNLKYQIVFDDEHGIYELKILGWEGNTRHYGNILHVEVTNNLIYIHFDGIEDGFATYLEAEGIGKDQIVLAWLSKASRKYSKYAIG